MRGSREGRSRVRPDMQKANTRGTKERRYLQLVEMPWKGCSRMFEAWWRSQKKAFQEHGAPNESESFTGLQLAQARVAGCSGWWLRWVVFQGCTEEGCSFAGRLRRRKGLLFREEPCETPEREKQKNYSSAMLPRCCRRSVVLVEPDQRYSLSLDSVPLSEFDIFSPLKNGVGEDRGAVSRQVHLALWLREACSAVSTGVSPTGVTTHSDNPQPCRCLLM